MGRACIRRRGKVASEGCTERTRVGGGGRGGEGEAGRESVTRQLTSMRFPPTRPHAHTHARTCSHARTPTHSRRLTMPSRCIASMISSARHQLPCFSHAAKSTEYVMRSLSTPASFISP